MGVTAWDKSYNSPGADISPEHGLTPEKRKEILDFGMAQLDKAIELNPDYFEAMLYKNLALPPVRPHRGRPGEGRRAHGEGDRVADRRPSRSARRSRKNRKPSRPSKNPLEAM